MRFWDFCWTILGCDRLHYGVLQGPDLGGLANDIPGTVSSGTMPTEPFVYGRNRHAHELAHDLGLRHVTFCGAQDPNAPPFPHTTVINDVKVATIGTMIEDQNSLIFGLGTNLLSESNNRPQAVIDPNEHFQLMSYCGRANLPFPSSIFRWISDSTYNAVRTAINNTFGRASILQQPEPTQDYLVMRGTVDLRLILRIIQQSPFRCRQQAIMSCN
jgi:hypothetical protein